MKTIIAGSRGFSDYQALCDVMNHLDWKPTTVISGCARGVDILGEQWAIENNIPVERYPADWKKYGRSAGPIRNRQMAENAEALVAFLSQKSRGTRDMISQAQKHGLKIHVHQID